MRRARRGSFHGNLATRLAALEARAEAMNTVAVVVAHVDGHVDGGGGQRWPSLAEMYDDLAKRQGKPPLVIQLAIDPPARPEEAL